MSSKRNYAWFADYNDILMYLDYNSPILFEYVRTNKSEGRFKLLRKYLTHSDLSTMGKPGKTQQLILKDEKYKKKFILYYDSLDELMSYKKLPTAAQSNIGMPDDFYKLLGIKSYKENNRKKYELDESWDKFIPVDTLADFRFEDFEKIRTFNNKNSYSKSVKKELVNFKFDNLKDDSGKFYKINKLTIAAHGLGVKTDDLLNYFRMLSFKGDVINILFDIERKKFFIFFERNEKYFELKSKINNSSISAPIWKEYSEEDKKAITLLLYSLDKVEGEIQSEESKESEIQPEMTSLIDEVLNKYFVEYNKTIDRILATGEKPKYRWYQKKWREVLIKLDEVAFNSKGYAFCAISGLKGKYEKLGRFFIASHIKPYSDCIKESDFHAAFDPHNGLILSANVDALFDQHLISVDTTDDGRILKKEVVNSISRLGSIIYKEKLNPQYMTSKRIQYLKMHKNKFDSQ